VLQLNASNADAHNNLGSVYEALGRFDEAIQMYKKSVSLKSFQEEAHYNLARLEYQLSGDSLDDAKKKEITERLRFLLSKNPRNRKVEQLLEKIER
jgi:Flp pilus assembly protein TadD